MGRFSFVLSDSGGSRRPDGMPPKSRITNALLKYRIAKIEFETAQASFDRVPVGEASQADLDSIKAALTALSDARRALCDAVDKAVS